ncbi:MAG: hypothetical protein HY720_08255 [Planctomycetes bacterium]|nr:hypothetical protein [Planctomycetota bacterium]
MRRAILPALLLLVALAVPAAAQGRIVRHAGFESRLLANERDVWVYLPAGYDLGSARYPVLYLDDGNNMFDPSAPFGGWRLQGTLDRMIAAGEMRAVIAVAVSNTPDRIYEYTPTEDEEYGGGGGGTYLRFLIEELKPFVDRTYRTERGAGSTGILGSSLGGLQAFHAAWTRWDVFGLSGAMSPSFWWDDRFLLREVQRFSGTPPRARFYLDSGDQGPSRDGKADTEAMRDALAAKGYEFGKTLSHWLDRGAAHNEIAWAGRVGRALAFLFPPGTPAPGSATTRIRVHFDVGWGHRIALRGGAPGWGSWRNEIRTSWNPGNVWVYETTAIKAGTIFEFKALVDGASWESGPNHVARGGETTDVFPRFP